MIKQLFFYLHFRDGFLNLAEFSEMLQSVFCDCGKSHDLSESDVEKMFKLMDENQVRTTM